MCRTASTLVALVFAASCAPADGLPDAATDEDAGRVGDAGERLDAGDDGGPSDGGPAPDAGDPDGGAGGDAGDPDGRCVDGEPRFPEGTFDDVPDLSLDGLAADGEPATLRLRDLYDPCAVRSTVLVLRFLAPWCGPCRWDLANTAALASGDRAGRVRVIDLVLGDRDNADPTPETLREVRALSDAPGTTAIAPLSLLEQVAGLNSPLPYVVLVDSRTLQRLARMANPWPDALLARLDRELADLDGRQRPVPPEPQLVDGWFNRKEWALIQAMRLVPEPPADPTNAVADLPAARDLGASLFSDPGLSPSGTVSCATCHDPAKGFADDRPTSTGAGTGSRNSPSATLASHARWQFWDGRAESLWAQALGPFENPLEFDSTRTFVARRVVTSHGTAYSAAFGAAPDLSDTGRFPGDAKPGSASWTAMSTEDRETVTRVFVNAGKAISTFERSLRVRPNRLDAYAAGDFGALTQTEKEGLSMFMVAACIQCHHGPNLTDDAFHNVRFPTGHADGTADRGRLDALGLLATAEFAADGPWSDSPGTARGSLVESPRLLGAFKTPPLRGVVHTAPYGHGGTLATLLEVVQHYEEAGLPPDDPRAVGVTDPWVPRFSRSHSADIAAFLGVLEAQPAQ